MIKLSLFRTRTPGLKEALCAAADKPLRPLMRAVLVTFAIAGLFGCSEGNGNTNGAEKLAKAEVPVAVATAVEKTMPVQLRAIGRIQAYSTVVMKPQVGGEIQSVHFKEGQEIKKGDLLFTIDPRPFEAQLKQAEANLAKDRAQQVNARKQADRYASVVKKGFVSEEQYDSMAANATALEAGVKADEAAVDTARLSVKYCYIRSPLDGSAGEVKVYAGNVIKANESELVTVNQTSPVNVSFSVPEQHLADIKKYLGEGKIEVLASLPGKEESQVRGSLAFIDNSVDFTTGTILLKAEFENKDKSLWPGQFANVTVTLAEQPGLLVLPVEAVQAGQKGQYAYVVTPDLSVEYREVVTGRPAGKEVVILKGISAGERVVTDGQLKLSNGAKIRIVNQ